MKLNLSISADEKDKHTDDTIDYEERWYTSFVQNSSSWCILIKRVYVLKNLQNNCNKSQSLHKYNVSWPLCKRKMIDNKSGIYCVDGVDR